MNFLMLLLLIVGESLALQCWHCHTPKILKIPGEDKKFANVMEAILHTGGMSMDRAVLDDPKNNFPGWEKWPKCDKMEKKRCPEGQVCGYNEMHHAFFTRTCVSMNQTLYKNETLNKCYVHGMMMHKTTFLYCNTDFCNEKEILGDALRQCDKHVWDMKMDMKDGKGKGGMGGMSGMPTKKPAGGGAGGPVAGAGVACLLAAVAGALAALVSM